MPTFSERQGLVAVPQTLQVDTVSAALRNSLWNVLLSLYDEREHWSRVAEFVAQLLRKVPVDELPYGAYDRGRWVREYFFELPWYGVYDICEFVAEHHRVMTRETHMNHPFTEQQVREIFNKIFEAELAGYRFVE